MRELHLTRAVVALGRPPARERGVTREYLLHQAIADLFGDREGRGYVWRELAAGEQTANVLVMSGVSPEASALHLAPPHRRVTSLNSRPFRPRLTPGERVDFEIRVNATRVVTSSSGDDPMMLARKVRRDIWDCVFASRPSDDVRMQDVYADWLRRKLDGVAEVGQTVVTERRLVRARRSLASLPMPFIAANLVGDLVVLDPGGLVASMVEGIGRCRAFGCGLLCLAQLGTRPRSSSVT